MKVACDTSVLIPSLAAWHPRNAEARILVRDRVDLVPSHVLMETFSVLTRLPDPHRLTPRIAGDLLESTGLRVAVLSDPLSLVQRMAAASLGGGAVYDALVAATAVEHDCVLLTLDRRARPTYDVMGAHYEVVLTPATLNAS